jgi:16S rRNA processing protein RimM
LNGDAKRWVLVARILRPRGNKGEVAAELLTDFPARLTQLGEVFLGAVASSGQVAPRLVRVKASWISQNHKGQMVFHFEGSDSIADAEKFRGLDVLLPIEQRVTLASGLYFVDELVGCAVFEACAKPSVLASSPCAMGPVPALLGIVRDVQFTGEDVSGTPILVIEAGAGELLVPLAEDICSRIDIAARRIDVTLPDGLRELNEGK